MQNFYLIDRTHGKSKKRKDRLYMIAAQIAIKYGSSCHNAENYTENHIREFWGKEDPYPSLEYFKKNIRVSGIKWYIRHNVECKDKIWNADFLHGFTQYGKIQWNAHRYPSFRWKFSPNVKTLVDCCPFGGTLSPQEDQTYLWHGVPALYLQPSTESISFMAGVLATGKPVYKNKIAYARYLGKFLPYLEEWGIPIEHKTSQNQKVFISPIWPALFTIKMPMEIRDAWKQLKRPYGVEFYPAILWKTYVNNNFPKNGVPYLRSRRDIYYKYKSEKGAMKTLEKLRFDKKMLMLDNRIKKVVKMWSDKHEAKCT